MLPRIKNFVFGLSLLFISGWSEVAEATEVPNGAPMGACQVGGLGRVNDILYHESIFFVG